MTPDFPRKWRWFFSKYKVPPYIKRSVKRSVDEKKTNFLPNKNFLLTSRSGKQHTMKLQLTKTKIWFKNLIKNWMSKIYWTKSITRETKKTRFWQTQGRTLLFQNSGLTKKIRLYITQGNWKMSAKKLTLKLCRVLQFRVLTFKLKSKSLAERRFSLFRSS